jgi:hypothetical protein
MSPGKRTISDIMYFVFKNKVYSREVRDREEGLEAI